MTNVTLTCSSGFFLEKKLNNFLQTEHNLITKSSETAITNRNVHSYPWLWVWCLCFDENKPEVEILLMVGLVFSFLNLPSCCARLFIGVPDEEAWFFLPWNDICHLSLYRKWYLEQQGPALLKRKRWAAPLCRIPAKTLVSVYWDVLLRLTSSSRS